MFTAYLLKADFVYCVEFVRRNLKISL